jgi:DNA-binding NtrC family response regulator
MKTVVLVEDDAMVALAFGIRLKAMGYLVHTACDAITAMSQVRKLRPDVVVLDIIFMTASQHPDLRKRAMELGAVGFLHKPFDANALADAIERALSPRDK